MLTAIIPRWHHLYVNVGLTEPIKLLHEVKRDHIVIVVTHDEEMLAACDEVIPMPGCLSGRGVEGPEDRNGVGVG